MNAMFEVLSGPMWQHLAMALLHTLWQGLAAGAALALVLRWIPAHRPEARYWVAFSALLGLLLCGLVTWSVLDMDWPVNESPSASEDSTGIVGEAGGLTPRQGLGERGAAPTPAREHGQIANAGEDPQDVLPALAFVIAGWLAGVALMVARMAGMVVGLRRFTGRPEVTECRIRHVVDDLRRALHLTQSLRIVETVEDFGPAVFGIVRPMVVLPVSMLTGLPPEVSVHGH